MLLMKKCYFDAIRSGRKTTTLRYWLRPRVKAGSLHRVRGLGQIQVHSVEAVDPAGLRLADAQADGFPDLASLWTTLERLYPPAARKGRVLYLVRFTMVRDS
jgi:hypothetical protein